MIIDGAGGSDGGGDSDGSLEVSSDAAARRDSGDVPAPDAMPSSGRTREQTCARWRADRTDMREGAWTGDVPTCVAGGVDAPGRDNALRLINSYRWLAGLPAVARDAGLDASAQQCALMMRANNQLSHMPPSTWNCYSAEGAAAAGRSNISTGPGVTSIDAYMNDWTSPNSLGHRRWILSGGLGPIGIGSTDRHSCLWVIGGGLGGGPSPWTAFPPPGPFPIDAARAYGHTLDGSGWSIQSDTINLAGAAVTVSADGEPLDVNLSSLAPGYGSASAIAFTPAGWQAEVGTTYRVEVTGLSTPIDYQVELVDCSE